MVTFTMAVLTAPLAVVAKLMSTWQLVSSRRRRRRNHKNNWDGNQGHGRPLCKGSGDRPSAGRHNTRIDELDDGHACLGDGLDVVVPALSAEDGRQREDRIFAGSNDPHVHVTARTPTTNDAIIVVIVISGGGPHLRQHVLPARARYLRGR
jgi:hypothetical protein